MMDACRTCLRNQTVDSGSDLFAAEQRTALQLLTVNIPSFDANADDGLPMRICHECRAQIEAFETFCAQAAKADRHHRINMRCTDEVKYEPVVNDMDTNMLVFEMKVKPENLINVVVDTKDEFERHSSRSPSPLGDHNQINHSDTPTPQPIESSSAAPKTNYKCRGTRSKTTNQKPPNKRPRRQRHSKDDSDPSTSSEKPTHFECDLCARRFSQKHLLAGHLRRHLGLVAHACDHCPQSFHAHGNLLKHLLKHQPDEQTACPHAGCPKTFRKPHYAHDHYERVHVNVKKKRQPAVCEQCGKAFVSRNSLNAHKLTHLDVEQYPYRCEECGHRFIAKQRYEGHMLRHRNIRNFPCTLCPSRMVSQVELRTHMLSAHGRETPRCADCGMEFASKILLNQHQLIAHQGREAFTCRFCGRQFAKVMSMRYHERIHTGEKPCACLECDQRFANPRSLNAHVIRCHEVR